MARHRAGGLLAVSIATLVLGADGALAQMPAAIGAPGQSAVVTLHATGAQIYDCKAGKDGKLVWVFREPIATLILDGKTVGRHYAGPTWEHTDGSAVTGKVAATAPAATPKEIGINVPRVAVSHRIGRAHAGPPAGAFASSHCWRAARRARSIRATSSAGISYSVTSRQANQTKTT